MKQELETITYPNGPISADQISDYQLTELARAIRKAVLKARQDPEYMRQFEEWKKEKYKNKGGTDEN